MGHVGRRSFVGQNLAHAGFRGADIRGVDFRRAGLRDADFSSARTGLRRGWAAIVVAVALVSSIAIGLAAGVAGEHVSSLLASHGERSQALGVMIAATLIVFLVATLWRGLAFAIRSVLSVVIGIAIAGAAIAIATGLGTGGGAAALLVFAVLASAIVALGTLARAAAGVIGTAMFALVAIAGALAGGILGGGITAVAIAIVSMIAGRHVVRGRKGYPTIERAALAAACRGGTRFRGADLRGATFTSAKLRYCDFRGADLAGARLDRERADMCLLDPLPKSES